ncbi:uncharacterized protein [Haliotis asinina]|uniref:uncharacterized protein isoform X2 n=1 Tax=Haliotis asinina TaxID=109174 RepID=UPI003531AB8C
MRRRLVSPRDIHESGLLRMKRLFPGIADGLVSLGLFLTHSTTFISPAQSHSISICDVACRQIAACCTFKQDSCKNLTRFSTSSTTEAFQILGKWFEVVGRSCLEHTLVQHKKSRRFDCAKLSEHPRSAVNLSRVVIASVSNKRLTDANLYQLHLNNLKKTKYLNFTVDVTGMAYLTSLKRLLIATHVTLLSYPLDENRLIHGLYLPGIQSMALDQNRRILFLIQHENKNDCVISFSVESNAISSVLRGYKPTSIVVHSSRGRFFIAIGSTIKSFDYNGQSMETVVSHVGQKYVLTLDPLEKNLYYCVNYFVHSSLYAFPFMTERKRKLTSFAFPMSNLLFYDDTLAVYTLNRKGDIHFLDFKDVTKVPEKKVRIFGESGSVAISLVQ